MNWLIDIALILTLVITVAIYIRKGFVKSFIGFFKFALSLIIAAVLAPHVGTLIYNAFMYNSLYSSIHGWFEGLGLDASIEDLANSLPEIITSMLKNIGVDIDALLAEYEGQEVTAALIDSVSESIASPVASFISNAIAYIVTFIVALIGLTVLAFILDKTCKLPVLKQANKILGAVMGLICGIINIFIAVTIITILLNLFGKESSGITVEAMKNSTIVYKFISNLDVLEIISKSLMKIK